MARFGPFRRKTPILGHVQSLGTAGQAATGCWPRGVVADRVGHHPTYSIRR